MLMEQRAMSRIPASIGLMTLVSCASDYKLTGERPDVAPGDVTECPFSEIAGTPLLEYDCNPVFESTNEAWGGDVGSVGFYATEVLGHPFYQMWYTSASSDQFGDFGLGYAVSTDGTNWSTHEGNPLFESDPTSWDRDSIAGQVVVWDAYADQYVMAYQGFTLGDGMFDPGIWGLGIATSPDGVVWDKHPNNPVIDFTNDFDIFTSDIQPCWPLTITFYRQSFRGYIAASRTKEALFGEAACHIYSMTSVDGGSWSIDESQPVMEAGARYDEMGVASAAIVEYEEVQYMFYVGFTDWVQYDGYQSAQNLTLNLATSTDGGYSWRKDPNNPLPVNLTSPGEVSSVGAQVIGSLIHVWVTDSYPDGQAVGYFLYDPLAQTE